MKKFIMITITMNSNLIANIILKKRIINEDFF